MRLVKEQHVNEVIKKYNSVHVSNSFVSKKLDETSKRCRKCRIGVITCHVRS